MRRNRVFALSVSIVVLALAIMLLATQASAAAAPASPEATPSGMLVKIVGSSPFAFAFQPATVTIHPGQYVAWKNVSVVPHTTTSDTGLWDSGPIAVGGHFFVKFPNAGTFTYHCSIHPFMHGTVVVQ